MTPSLTVGDIVQKSAEYLRVKGVDSPRLDAELLLAHVLECDRLKLYLNWDRELDEPAKQAMRELLQRRGQQREPIARIIGQREFYGRPFHVGKQSFVPRPETEWLVERSLERLKGFRRDPDAVAAFAVRKAAKEKAAARGERITSAAEEPAATEGDAIDTATPGGPDGSAGEKRETPSLKNPTDQKDRLDGSDRTNPPDWTDSSSPDSPAGIPLSLPPEPRIIDLGTGTGCVAISLALERADAEVYATDISEEALRIARDNASALGAAHRVRFHRGDLFAGLEGPFDLVVSNPPYIESGAIEGLMPEVAAHDPRRALDGGEKGLEIYQRIIEEAPDRMLPGAPVLLEIGEGQGNEVAALLQQCGEFDEIRIVKDLAGLERYVEAVLSHPDDRRSSAPHS